MLDIEKLPEAVTNFTFESVHDILMKIPKEDITSVALVSDESGSTLGMAINTLEYLNKKNVKYPGDPYYFKWCPSEWKFDFFESDSIGDKLNEALYEFSTSDSELGWEPINFFQICVEALKKLRLKKIFDENVIFVFHVTDWEDPVNEKKWIISLNNTSEAKEFCKWIDSLE